MEYFVLASSSSGNATIIKGKSGYLLIDCGINRRNLLYHLAALKIDIEALDGVFFTHRHTDHLISPSVITRLFPPAKIFAHHETYPCIKENSLEALTPVFCGEFKLVPLPLSHDAPTFGFLIIENQERLAYMTDTGYLNQKLFPLIENATHFLIEANYDDQMLLTSGRPFHLIQRIMDTKGHLSNHACGQILAKVIGPETTSICLMHLSQECNLPDLAALTVKSYLPNYTGSLLVSKPFARTDFTLLKT